MTLIQPNPNQPIRSLGNPSQSVDHRLLQQNIPSGVTTSKSLAVKISVGFKGSSVTSALLVLVDL